VILFSLDPARRSIQIVERVGESMVNKNAVAQLIYSPVRDVAEDRKVVIANEINERERKRFQYLLEFSPMLVSCVGVPVPAQSSMRYALFALDRRAKQFGDERQMYAQGMALAIGAALDQNDLRERSALMQRSALIGNLASGMMHEINNLVAPLQNESVVLRKKIAQFEKDPAGSSVFINDQIGRLQEDIRRIINTTKVFSRLTAKGRDEILRIDDIIEETRFLLRDISERANVLIHFDRPDTMLIARAPSAVLEQIILNVTLNAIQQIAEFRPGIRGWVRIMLEVVNDTQDGQPLCRVLAEDNGPGIHARLWEKIFEAGYSTRREGSGIGLYISRNLMRELGGEVYISRSHILSGTTFVLEFPVHL
jgi:signal transduction histidine kinase